MTIERAAKALIDNYETALGAGAEWEWESQARAAIEAMREPTPEMIEAGWGDGWWEDTNPAACWKRMIDAMLKEEPPK